MKHPIFIQVRTMTMMHPLIVKTVFFVVITNHFYNTAGGDRERVLLHKFLEATTPYSGIGKERIARVVSERYFDFIDTNNATQFIKSFINVCKKENLYGEIFLLPILSTSLDDYRCLVLELYR